jgi:hypothetical protein
MIEREDPTLANVSSRGYDLNRIVFDEDSFIPCEKKMVRGNPNLQNIAVYIGLRLVFSTREEVP